MKLIGPTLFILGVILIVLSFFMLWPLCIAGFYESGNQVSFLLSAVITSAVGVGFTAVGRNTNLSFAAPRQLFLTTSAAWIGVSIFSSLPFLLIDHPLSIADAIFESVSGVTTTGSTVLTGLDYMARDLLLWRSLLNWIGGIGVVGMAIAILPFLHIGGMRLFKTESSDWSEKAMPRARNLIKMMVYCYLGLSLLCTVMFWASGMHWFNAINHAMATVSTGGYSTSDSSFAQFDNLLTHWIAILFMLAGAMPFVLFVRIVVHRKFTFFNDSQVRGLMKIVLLTSVILTGHLLLTSDVSAPYAFTHATFNLVSVITTCGFASTDYQLWGNLPILVFFFCTFIGGCSGSTSGGLKIFRLQLLAGMVKGQCMTAVHPHAVVRQSYNGRLIDKEILSSCVAFIFMMIFCWVIISALLASTGLDLITSITGAATALANVGPGLGNVIGPAGNFSTLSDTAKWALAAGMLLGRLEFLTLLVLFSRVFWKN